MVPNVSKKHAKLIKHNLKFIMLINDVLLFLDSTQLKLNSIERNMVFEHEFRIFGVSNLSMNCS